MPTFDPTTAFERPQDGKLVELTRGYWAIVDEADFDKISRYSWCLITPTGCLYAQAWVHDINNKRHVCTMGKFISGDDSSKIIKYKNGNGLDNRRENILVFDKYECVKCSECGNEFKAGIKNGQRSICCGQKCVVKRSSRLKKEKELAAEKICKHCGNQFYAQYRAYQQYCCDECVRLAKVDLNRKIVVGNCLSCGERVQSYRAKLFCNRECRINYVMAMPEGSRERSCNLCGKNKFLYDFSLKVRRDKASEELYFDVICNSCRYECMNNIDRNSDKYRNSKLRSSYGITLEEYNNILKKQDYKCAICGMEEKDDKFLSKFTVDHCHRTGKVRGITCGNCNISIGKLGDSSEMIYRAYLYLKKHEEENG